MVLIDLFKINGNWLFIRRDVSLIDLFELRGGLLHLIIFSLIFKFKS